MHVFVTNIDSINLLSSYSEVKTHKTIKVNLAIGIGIGNGLILTLELQDDH